MNKRRACIAFLGAIALTGAVWIGTSLSQTFDERSGPPDTGFWQGPGGPAPFGPPRGDRQTPPPPPPPPPRPNRLAEALDVDGNHTISATELDDAVATLRKLDVNGDGALDEGEFELPPPDPRRRPRQAEPRGFQGNRRPMPPGPRGIDGPPNEYGPPGARRSLNEYGPFGGYRSRGSHPPRAGRRPPDPRCPCDGPASDGAGPQPEEHGLEDNGPEHNRLEDNRPETTSAETSAL